MNGLVMPIKWVSNAAERPAGSPAIPWPEFRILSSKLTTLSSQR